MSKKEIYKNLYIEVDRFMHLLPDRFVGRIGIIHFYFDFNSLAYKERELVCAEYQIGDNSVTFFLENIKRAKKQT